jgi:hypothetical protein
LTVSATNNEQSPVDLEFAWLGKHFVGDVSRHVHSSHALVADGGERALA